ncbi:MarR family transcriptional regulator [Cytobacillus horneckiae]|uniref:MarR family transcriptional regulator n=1 Tax=Cytobacillus horneckiae TaxID=549687 RepID=UPI0039A15A37
MLPEESAAIKQLSKNTNINLDAIAAVTSLYTIGQGIKNKLEQEILANYKISWTSFSILYDLWIHGSMETKQLAKSAGVTKATISNITNTLERKELCYRKADLRDRRLTYVVITEEGKRIMEELYPHFHKGEIDIVASASNDELTHLSMLLRRIIRDNNF